MISAHTFRNFAQYHDQNNCMKIKHTLTQHAIERIAERSTSSPDSILDMIDNGFYVPIGCDTGSNRSHELLYSPYDNTWFIVIRDIKTFEIITFLPVDYHENLAWKISFDALETARNIICGEKQSNAKGVDHLQEPTTYKLSVVFYPEPEKHVRRNIGSWMISPYESVLDLMEDDEFIRAIIDRMNEKEIAIDEFHGLGIKKRKNDPYIYLPTDILLKRFQEIVQSID
jgi:hypothetical protein